MKHTLINADYDYNNSDINLYTRDENGKRNHLKIIDFEPYFYIPSDEHIFSQYILNTEDMDIKSTKNDKITKITVTKPRNVKDLRSQVSKHFEGDIPFPRRFLIDSEIYNTFEIDEGKILLQWKRLKPCQHDCKIRKVYCDIETYSKGKRFPLPTDDDAMVTINGLYDDWTKQYLTLIVKRGVNKTERFADDHIVQYVPTEKRLLEITKEFMESVQPDIFTAWYLPFDKEYLDTRAEKYGIVFPWEKTNDFDSLGAYKKLYHKSNNELSTIVREEELEVPNYQKFKHEMWETNDQKEAILTNKSHVESIVVLDERKKLLDFYWNLKKVVGFESLNETLFHGKLVDIMLLRYYKDKWVLPSSPSSGEKKERKKRRVEKVGGKVLTPPFGLFENLGVFDMSRYYPEMLISQNLSPEPHSQDEMGIVPKLTLYLINERMKYDKQLATLDPGTEEWKQLKFQRNSVKFVTETIIGYFGSEASRVYDLEIFNKVTEMGQRGLLFLQKVCNKDGNKVIYGDTDGLTVNIPSVEYAISYVDTLNNYLKDFCKEEGITRELTLKLDRFYSIYLIKKVTEKINGVIVERGAKKRYAGRIIFEDGKFCDYLAIKGFEYVRRDAPPVTKRIQPTIFDFIFENHKEKVHDYLQTEVNDIKEKYKNGDLSLDDIAIPTTIKPLHEYGGLNKNGKKKGIPPYARGVLYSNQWFGTEIRGGDQIKMLYVSKVKGYPSTDVVSYIDIQDIPSELLEVDIDKMIDRCIKKKIEDVIDLIDLSWDEIFSKTKNLFEV